MMAGMLDDHDRSVTSKRYDQLIGKVGENSDGLEKVKEDVSKIRSSIKRVEEIKSFNDAKESSTVLASIREHLNKIDNEISNMKSEDSVFRKKVLCSLNVREQRDHNWSVRIKNWQSPLTHEKITESLIYKQLIYPTLELALQAGEIDHLGDRMGSHIEQCHFLRHREGSIPVCIFRFFSRKDLMAFMSMKRTVLEELNARITNCRDGQNNPDYPLYRDRRIKVQHSLSHLNKNLETFCHTSNVVKRTKVAGTTLCVMQKGTNGPWRRIENPFGHSFSEMFRPIEKGDSSPGRSPLETFIALAPKDRSRFFESNKQFHVREADFVLPYTGVVTVENPTAKATDTQEDFPTLPNAPAEGSQESAAAANGGGINRGTRNTRQRRAAFTTSDTATAAIDSMDSTTTVEISADPPAAAKASVGQAGNANAVGPTQQSSSAIVADTAAGSANTSAESIAANPSAATESTTEIPPAEAKKSGGAKVIKPPKVTKIK